ncbi:MAG: hypothetical protein QOJ60_2490 [Actinomycetota bacterium]|nr:hypothetical protein [Actinomycetota bacterium]
MRVVVVGGGAAGQLAAAPSVERVASGLIRCLDDDRMGPTGRRTSRPGEEPPPTRLDLDPENHDAELIMSSLPSVWD